MMQIRQPHGLLALYLFLMAGTGWAGGFVEPDLQMKQDATTWVMDGNLNYRFSKTAQEALDNGMPLVIRTDIRVRDKDAWFWQGAMVEKHLVQHIQYHALSQQYLVRGMQQAYPQARLTIASAVEALGVIDDLVLLEMDKTVSEGGYEVSLNTRLDIEALPSPLRPLAYVSVDWRLESGWLTSRLQQGPFGAMR